MFVNCPHCQSLVAVDAVTGVAPEHCPYCDGAIGDVQVQTDGDTAIAQEVAPVDGDVAMQDVTADPVTVIEASANDVGDVSEGTTASAMPTHGEDATQTPQYAPTARKRRKNTHPSFAMRLAASDTLPRRARWPWPLAAALLLLLLLQLVLADRASLAASASWRAAIVTVCNVVRCDLPPWREVRAFTMVTRDVQAHPDIAGALRIRAAFRNDAHWPQPWPQLVVTLSDASGRVTGSRTFSADEYLGDAPTQKLIATGQTAAVALEIREPAPDTVSFSFDFR